MANEIGLLKDREGTHIVWTTEGIKQLNLKMLHFMPLDSWNGMHCLDVDAFIANEPKPFGMFLGEYDEGKTESYWQPLQYDDVNPQFKLALSMMGAKYDEELETY